MQVSTGEKEFEQDEWLEDGWLAQEGEPPADCLAVGKEDQLEDPGDDGYAYSLPNYSEDS